MAHSSDVKTKKIGCPYCPTTFIPKRKNQITCASEDCKKKQNREKMREYGRKRREDPEYREKEREAQRKRRKDPKVREKMREYSRKYRLKNKG